jgi:hypothetical protein
MERFKSLGAQFGKPEVLAGPFSISKIRSGLLTRF